MNGPLTFVILILFVTFLLAFGIAAFSWQRRHAGVWAYPFSLAALAAGWWAIFYALALLKAAYQLPKTYRWQNIALAAGALIPWLANAVYLLNLSVFLNIDLSSVAFVLSGLVL